MLIVDYSSVLYVMLYYTPFKPSYILSLRSPPALMAKELHVASFRQGAWSLARVLPPHPRRGNKIEALVIVVGFGGASYYSYNKEP